MKPKPSLTTKFCLHCGSAIPSGMTDYCCSGCETVAGILKARGWDRFYKLRTRDPRPMSAVGNASLNFDYLASEAYQTQHLTKKDGHWQFTWFLTNVQCAACLWLVDKIGLANKDVESISCRLEDGKTTISAKPGCDLPALASAFAEVGLPPSLMPVEDDSQNPELLRLGLSGALAANIMLFSLPFYVGLEDGRFAILFGCLAAGLSLALAWIGGRPFFQKAWQSLRHGVFHFDQPIALGIASALVMSFVQLALGHTDQLYFDSMAMLIFFLLLGRYLRAAMLKKAQRAGRRLLANMPQMTTVLRQGQWVLCEAEYLQCGDHLRLKAGDVLPVDAILVSQEGIFNQQVVSGESDPITHHQNANLTAGTINIGPPVEVRASSTQATSAFAKLHDLAETFRQNRQAGNQSRTAAIFLAAVFLLAGLGFFLWLPVSPFAGLKTSLTIFIVACPCALALAKPTAQGFALHRAAQSGIWIKSLNVFQRLPGIRQFIFDKTGVLTNGADQAVEIRHFLPNPKWLESAVSQLEAEVDHPLANALRDAFTPHLALGTVQDVTLLEGQGIAGKIASHQITVCNPGYLKRTGLAASVQEKAKNACGELPEEATHLCVFMDQELAAVIAVKDSLRPEAKAVFEALKRTGVRRTILSGDRDPVVQALAKTLDADEAHGAQSPREKLAYLKAHHNVPLAMMGDGLNDMGALAAAPVSFTHAMGSNAALQFSDVIFSSRDLSGLLKVIQLADRAKVSQRRGFLFSLGYNAAAVLLALGGVIGPLIAAILMPLSSLTLLGITYLHFPARPTWAS